MTPSDGKIDVIDHNVMNDGRVRDYPTLSWYFVAPYLESISWHQSQTPTNHTLYEKNKAEIMCMKKSQNRILKSVNNSCVCTLKKVPN